MNFVGLRNILNKSNDLSSTRPFVGVQKVKIREGSIIFRSVRKPLPGGLPHLGSERLLKKPDY